MFTNNPGKLIPIDQTISGFQEILAGKYYHLPEVALKILFSVWLLRPRLNLKLSRNEIVAVFNAFGKVSTSRVIATKL